MSKAPRIFISYRKDDTSPHAHWLAESLRAVYSPESVFIDDLRAGSQWPKALRAALEAATVILPVIGPQWLRVVDEHNRRRIDLPDDWVRMELAFGLQENRHILPVLVWGALPLPREALPEPLAGLADVQAHEMREAHWHRDLDALLDELDLLGFERVSPGVVYPFPHVTPPALTDEEYASFRAAHPRWSQRTSLLPGYEPKMRTELVRTYEFRSFEEAIEFMYRARGHATTLNHHPRWENIWRTVTVALTTWDIGHRPSLLDLQMAERLDAEFEAFLKRTDRDPDALRT